MLYPIFSLVILTSILGYGKMFYTFNNVNYNFLNLKNLVFIYGLIFVSFFSIILNFFLPISNLITFLIILIGSIFYIFSFLKLKSKVKEVYFLIIIIIFSFIFSFYAGVNDDFAYHYETIKNYKNKNIFEIYHQRMVSYNSNWLFINSILSIDYFTSTIFILSSLIYSILIYDTYSLYINSLKNKNFHIGIIAFFILIFSLGVLNKYKDFGTDIPGTIISFYVLMIAVYFIFDKKYRNLNNVLFFILPIASFAFIIKITNSLLCIYLILFLLYFNIRLINYKLILVSLILPLVWFFQNYNISGCLIWPIEITCFRNNDLAIQEYYLIESFAKGDITTKINVNNFDWIYLWLKNHSTKLIETYLLFILIIFFPIFYFVIKNKNIKKEFLSLSFKHFKNLNFLMFLFTILLSNIIWFLYAPAYRFGVFYNFSLIIFLALPFWLEATKMNYFFILNYTKIIIYIVFIYFFAVNISKYNWYAKRFDVWPPIQNNELISRKDF